MVSKQQDLLLGQLYLIMCLYILHVYFCIETTVSILICCFVWDSIRWPLAIGRRDLARSRYLAVEEESIE